MRGGAIGTSERGDRASRDGVERQGGGLGEDFGGQGGVVFGAVGVGGVLEDGLSEAGGLGEANVAANAGGEDLRAAPGALGFGLAGEEVFEIAGDLAGQAGAGFVKAENDAGDAELVVEALVDE